MRRTSFLILAASILLAACGGGGGGDVVATVGETELTSVDVQEFPYEQSGTIDQARFAQYLSALIQWEILDAAAAREFGIDPSEEEVDAELESVLATQASGMSLAEVAESQNLSESTIRRVVRVRLLQERVSEELAGEAADPDSDEIERALADERAGLTEVCARHLLVATTEEAEEARTRIEGGEDFEAVAQEVSTDPSAADNGGDLGCSLAQRYVPEFRDAAVAADLNTLTDPVETEFGFHIIEVYDRTEPDDADLPSEEEIRQELEAEAGVSALQEWMMEKVSEAEVTVEEEYGTWTLEPEPGVVPPAS